MTIEYKDSKRIVKLSTDAVETVTYTGDMDSSGWNDSNKGSTLNLDTTNNEVDFLNTTGYDSVAFDTSSIETLSASAWVVRFKLRLSGTQSGDWGVFWYVMSSVRDLTANSTLTDCAGISTQRDPSSTNISPNLSMGNDDKLSSTEVQTRLQLSGSNIQITKDTDYYVEITRDGSNFTDTIYSDSSFSTILGTKTNAITGSGLRYFVFANYNQGSGSTATVSDFKWYNGVSSLSSKPTNVQDNSILVEKDTGKRYWRTPESTSAPVDHTYGTFQDTSGIDNANANPRGGWGQQVKTGHPLVGKSLKTLTVYTKYHTNTSGRIDRDMTVKVFAGLNSATIRGTSDAISTSTLTTIGTWYTKTFTFATPVPISADDCILVCVDGDTATAGGWSCKIQSSPEDTNKGYWVTFSDANYPPANAVQTNRSMVYTAGYVTVTPATWTYPPHIGQIAQLSGSNSSNNYTSASEFYTISTDTWDTAFNISGGARARAGSAGSTEHAYLMGGQDGSSYYSTIDKVAWSDETNTTISRSTRAWGGAVANAVSVCVGQSYYSGSYQTGINEYTYGTMAETSQGNTSSSHAFGGSFGNSTYGFVINGQNTGIERYTYSDKSKTASGFTASPTTTNPAGGHTGNSTTGISVNNTAGSGNARYDAYNISADTWTTNSATSTTPYENGKATGSTKYDLFSTQTNTGTARQCEKYNYSSGVLSSFTSVATNLDGGDQDAGASSTNTGVNS